MFSKYQWDIPADATISQAAGTFQATIQGVSLADSGAFVLVNRVGVTDGSAVLIQCPIQGADFAGMTAAAVSGASQGAAINAAMWAAVQAKHQDLISFNRMARTGEAVPAWAAV